MQPANLHKIFSRIKARHEITGNKVKSYNVRGGVGGGKEKLSVLGTLAKITHLINNE